VEILNPILEFFADTLTTAGWIAPIFALAAGVITSFLPCCLSSIPLVVGYVGGVGADTKRAFRMSVTFSVGMAITMTTLGVAAALLGRLMSFGGTWFYLVLGALMVLMSLQLFGVFEFVPSTYLTSKTNKRGYLGALIAGILGGLFASPCATPVLVVLLSIVATQGNIIWGVVLLLLYSVGHSVLVILAGTFVGFTRQITASPHYGRISKALNIVLGLLTLALGLYMFYLGF
jgi:cytochrome c biogenesis protein CcdA